MTEKRGQRQKPRKEEYWKEMENNINSYMCIMFKCTRCIGQRKDQNKAKSERQRNKIWGSWTFL